MGTVWIKDGAIKPRILKINTIKMKAGSALNATKKLIVGKTSYNHAGFKHWHSKQPNKYSIGFLKEAKQVGMCCILLDSSCSIREVN